MAEMTHRMDQALRCVKPLPDEDVRKRALRLVERERPNPSEPQDKGYRLEEENYVHALELGTTLWRLLDRLDGEPEPEPATGADGVEPSPAMQVALVDLNTLDDAELRLAAERLVLQPGIAPRNAGAAIWRLLDRIDGYRRALDNVTSVAPHSGTETSRKAAKEIAPLMTEMRYVVLGALCKVQDPGLTAQQIEDATGMAGNSVRPRLTELVTLGWVEKTSRVRKTRSGRDAAVYVVTYEGNERYIAEGKT